MNSKVHCKDVELNFEDTKYIDDEIKILSCGLNYTISSFINQNLDDLICRNGKLLKSSKDAGIEWGNLVLIW